MSTDDSELRRIREAYERYATAPSEVRKRDASNPGLRLLQSEWHRRVAQGLAERSLLTERRAFLDLGCGGGHLLSWLVACGAAARNCYGVDVMAERIRMAQSRLPEATFVHADAADAPWSPRRFDVVIASMLFSSVLDHGKAAQIARAASEAVTADGVILVYDTRMPNPLNPNVRAVRRAEIAQLFSGFDLKSETVSVLPPLARVLGRLGSERAEAAYRRLARVPLLRARNLCALTSGRSGEIS